MRRVLFVDGEPRSLEGLRQTLSRLGGEWEVAFAGSGAEALARLGERRFDAVVSDIGMPGTGGAELLTEVSRLHPRVVRIGLSARAEWEAAVRSVGTAHQYLARPCSADTLRQTVGRACALRDLLANDSLRQIVSQMPALPSLPSLYAQLVEELRGDNTSVKRAGAIISRDLGMTAKTLQLVNSAFFGLRRAVSDPAGAVRLLGLDKVTSLVLSVSVFTHFSGRRVRGFSEELLRSHSVRVAGFARAIARAEKCEAGVAEESFTAGLLHDAGVLILAHGLPEWYEAALALMAADGTARAEAERLIFGTSHAEVGAYLLGLRGLPHDVVEAVAFHGDDEHSRAGSFDALSAVRAANRVDHALSARSGAAQPPRSDSAPETPTSPAGCDDPRLQSWEEVCLRVLNSGERAA